jgi:hypothetical protein
MNNVGFIVHMLGLGDHISYNGLIRRLLIDHNLDCIYVGAWPQYYSSVQRMFSDDPRIIVVNISSGAEYHYIREYFKQIKPSHWYLLGHTILPGQPFEDLVTPDTKYYQISWGELREIYPYGHRNYYEYLNIDWKHRFISCYFNRNIPEETRVFNKLNPNHEEYIFVQDDGRRGFSLDMNIVQKYSGNYKIIYNDTTENLFDMYMILQNAKQIHLMESSVRCLIETIPMENGEFYLHHYIRNSERLVYDDNICPIETRKPWVVLQQ